MPVGYLEGNACCVPTAYMQTELVNVTCRDRTD